MVLIVVGFPSRLRRSPSLRLRMVNLRASLPAAKTALAEYDERCRLRDLHKGHRRLLSGRPGGDSLYAGIALGVLREEFAYVLADLIARELITFTSNPRYVEKDSVRVEYRVSSIDIVLALFPEWARRLGIRGAEDILESLLHEKNQEQITRAELAAVLPQYALAPIASKEGYQAQICEPCTLSVRCTPRLNYNHDACARCLYRTTENGSEINRPRDHTDLVTEPIPATALMTFNLSVYRTRLDNLGLSVPPQPPAAPAPADEPLPDPEQELASLEDQAE
eukprot:m.91264 g.91264  ORF g.91264 m.91264 type:complete len:280 (+) comp8487_c1_seq9:217-1056(+)